MTPRSSRRRSSVVAGLALLALAVLANGCARPADENWLRVLSIEDASGSVTANVSSIVEVTTITDTATTTELGSTDFVTVVFTNQSTVVGSSAQAGGVTVEQVRISYAAAGYPLPSATYELSLYVPASADGKTTTKTELSVALVSTSLKSWLETNVPSSALTNGLNATAKMVFRARTDEGGELEVEAGISILFENSSVDNTTGF